MEWVLPFDRTYWVIPGIFLAGPYPGSHDPGEALPRLRALVQCGIRRVISLMDADEIRLSDPPFLPYAETLIHLGEDLGIPLEATQLPIQDQSPPSPAVMNAILDEIERSIAANRPVYVHCWGGRGRTGTVIACHLVRQGCAGEEGLKRLDELRKVASNGHLPSPKTEAQREFVRSWRNWDRRSLL
jgi:hypothetical protein